MGGGVGGRNNIGMGRNDKFISIGTLHAHILWRTD